MMNQETYVRVHELHKQGWTIGEIAAETGFHPETISIQLRSDGPPGNSLPLSQCPGNAERQRYRCRVRCRGR